MNKFEEIIWPALSITSIYFFINLSCFLIISLKSNFYAYTITSSLNLIVLPTVFVFFGISGLNKYLWKLWTSFPNYIHKIMTMILLFIMIPIIRVTPAVIKDNYDKK